MAVVTKPTLKSYFEDGKEPDENKYIDLIDTMGLGYGDMLKSVYDTNDDGKVNSAAAADLAADSSKLGNVLAVEYLKRVSANRPGVTKLYRNDADSAYNLQTFWNGSRWVIQGYNGDAYHAPALVDYANIAGNADTLDNYHASDLYRDDASFATSGYLDTSSYVDAALGWRVNGVTGGIINLYSSPLTYGNWTGGTGIGAGAYTLTRANYGYGADAIGLYGRLMAKAVSGTGYVGINTNSTLYDWPIAVATDATNWQSEYGIWWLTAKGGNFIVRIGSVTTYVVIQIWGEVR